MIALEEYLKRLEGPSFGITPASNPKNHAALLIIPGGGYYGLWFDKEGVDIANWANGLGISAFVLKYRLPTGKMKIAKIK